MKNCPHCGRSYSDSDIFCEADGSKLTAPGAPRAASATGPAPDGGAIACPNCGGQAEPGEVICNYCGTRLEAGAEAPSPAAATRMAQSGGAEPWAPPSERGGPREFGDESPYPENPPEADEVASASWRLAGFFGYSLAALIALAAGVWLAIHLSGRHVRETPVAQTSPAARPATQEPSVTLAQIPPVTVRGADLAGVAQRDPASARAVFAANRDALLDTYKRALEGDAGLRDGMLVRVRVRPDGSVNGGAVLVSTTPNPSLDAEVVAAIGGWKFPVESGGAAEIDYPLIFATGPGDIGALETDLGTQLAARTPGATPEYASAPAPTPVAAVTPPARPVVMATPRPVVMATPTAPRGPSRAELERRRRRERASAPRPSRPPAPPLRDRVTASLRGDRRFGRVRAYTSPSGLVTLTGMVFDDKAKLAAARAVGNVSGVTSVVNDLTTETSQWAANQAAIQQALQTAGLTGVTAKVIGRSCYLDGTVKREFDRERAVTIAMGAAPVKVASNLIRVNPGFFGW